MFIWPKNLNRVDLIFSNFYHHSNFASLTQNFESQILNFCCRLLSFEFCIIDPKLWVTNTKLLLPFIIIRIVYYWPKTLSHDSLFFLTLSFNSNCVSLTQNIESWLPNFRKLFISFELCIIDPKHWVRIS